MTHFEPKIKTKLCEGHGTLSRPLPGGRGHPMGRLWRLKPHTFGARSPLPSLNPKYAAAYKTVSIKIFMQFTMFKRQNINIMW